MRNFLAVIGAATIAFLGVGWYLGWYQVSNSPSSPGKQSLQVDINPDKITEDVKKGVEKGGEIVNNFRDKPKSEPTGPATNFFTPTPPPGEKNPPTGWRPIGDSQIKDNAGALGSRPPRN